ncbi:hypothetical protein K438DRAFT_1969095 [Mycena galopus ATCC 62051]|nr:hypothetical protein K438DRAFT_1969095 [Mycena galopus ATCC 62051]
MYLDDTADVDHDADMHETESSNEDDDSYEVQVRRRDEQDFPMAEILGGHQDRLRADAPYRILPHLLELTPSGSLAPTPAYIPRPPQTTARSPTPEFRLPIPHEAYVSAPQLQGSRAPTPQYTGPALSREQTLLFLPDSRGPTPYPALFSRGPTPLRRHETLLFLPDSRGPTPYPHDLRGPTPEVLQDMPTTYLQRDFTPMTFATSQMRARSLPGACTTSLPSPPPTKRRRVDSDDDSDGEQDQDDRDSNQEEEETTLSRRFNRPNKSVPRRLDLAAEDEDEDPELDDKEEDQETQADKEQVNDPVIRIPRVDALSGDDENGKDEIPVIPGTWVNVGIGEHTCKETLIGYAPVKIQQQLSIELTHGTWIRAGNRCAMVLSTSIEHTYRASPTRERSGQSAMSGTQRYREVLLICALADTDDDSEMAVVPGTWVKTRKGPQTHKGIVFVLSTTELYQDVHIIQARCPTAPPRERPAFHIIRAKLQKGSDQWSAFPKSRYPRLDPTPEQLLLFVGSRHPDLLTLPFHGLSPALAKGDRVVVVAGEHKGLNGFIFALAERWDKKEEQNVQYAKLVPPGPGGVYQTRKHLHTGNDSGHDNSGGACVELAHLKRSTLDICYTFRINDRVRVVSGILYKGVIGWVTAVANDSLTISIPQDCDVVGPTTAHFNDQSFTISIEHITREWHLGDSVRVRYGEYKDSVGVIVGAPRASCKYFAHGNQKTGVEHTLGEPDTRLLQVRAAEVDREAESASLKEGTAPYTRPGYLVAPLGVNPPTAAEREYMKGGRTQLEAQRALMHTGRGWYQGMDAVVVGHVGWLVEGTQKVGGTRCPLHTGLHGVMVGDYDSPVHAARLKSTRRRTALPLRDDQQGILVTIGEHAGRRLNKGSYGYCVLAGTHYAGLWDAVLLCPYASEVTNGELPIIDS